MSVERRRGKAGRLKLSGTRITAGRRSGVVGFNEDEDRGDISERRCSYGFVLVYVCVHYKQPSA